MVTRLLAAVINFFFGLVEIFLGLRFILRLFGANPDVSFVQWIYGSSDILMQPFRGIFTPGTIGRDHTVDFSVLFAMVVYGIIALFFVWVLNLLTPVTAKTTKK